MVDIKTKLHDRKIALQRTKRKIDQGLTISDTLITKDDIRESLKSSGILDNNGQVVTLIKTA